MTFSFLSFLTSFLFTFLGLFPVQHAMAVRTQRDTLLDFCHGGGKPSVSHQLVNTFFIGASDDVVEVDNRRVLQTTVGAFLRRFKLIPYFFLSRPVNAGGFNMLFFILLVPVVSVLLLFFFALDEVFVWH